MAELAKEQVKAATVKPSASSDKVVVELTGGLSYHLLDGPSFLKGRPQEVDRKLADRLLATGLFQLVGGANVPDTRRTEGTGD